MAYKKSAADLVQEGEHAPLLLVVTRDKGRELLVTMALEDFLDYAYDHNNMNTTVAVQCKGRARSWIGTLYKELKEAVKNG